MIRRHQINSAVVCSFVCLGLLFTMCGHVAPANDSAGNSQNEPRLVTPNIQVVVDGVQNALIVQFEAEVVDLENLEKLDVEVLDPTAVMPPSSPTLNEATKETIRVELDGFLDQFGGGVAAPGNSLAVEDTVSRALEWLARHQLSDGGWDFDHRKAEPEGKRTDGQGDLPHARNGATALAILSFLSTGQTHLQGRYKDTLRRGIEYLLRNQKKSKAHSSFADGGDMHLHGMYSHGLATIALCEAYATTGDKNLQEPAQLAVNYIVYAQDPNGGGWRYNPKQPGDMSVTGSQIRALKSAHMVYLTVSPKTILGAIKFLDSVAKDGGAFYGYTSPGQGAVTTAIGLRCRLYFGWEHDHPALQRGVKWLCELGPALEDGKSNMYFNYFATQVIAEIGGVQWTKWKESLHDGLIAKQSREGLSAGSWFLTGDQGADRGGRLYCTTLAVLSFRPQGVTPIIKLGDAKFPRK